MHKPTTPLRLGALRAPGETPDRFALGEVLGRHNRTTGRLLTEQTGVEWGGR